MALRDHMQTLLSSPVDTKIVSALSVRLPAKVSPRQKFSWALMWNRAFYSGKLQTITSPSALAESMSVMLALLLANTVTPSEWSSNDAKNGFANIFSNLAAFKAR